MWGVQRTYTKGNNNQASSTVRAIALEAKRTLHVCVKSEALRSGCEVKGVLYSAPTWQKKLYLFVFQSLALMQHTLERCVFSYIHLINRVFVLVDFK